MPTPEEIERLEITPGTPQDPKRVSVWSEAHTATLFLSFGEQFVAGAVGAIELRLVGAKAADQGTHPIGIAERKGGA